MPFITLIFAFMLQSGLYMVDTVKDVSYGRARGYWCRSEIRDDNFARQAFMFPKAWRKRDLTLCMDIYRPAGAEEPRPLVMLMHGGAFFANSKESMPVSGLCCDLAANGYVAVSVDYRMGFNLNRKSVDRASARALEDASEALAFLIEHSAEFGIDTSAVFIGGASSGAITALKLAACCKDAHIIGVIDMWGGVECLELLDDCDAALIAFHGELDKTVPFSEGYPMGGKALMSYMYGSSALVDHLLSLGRNATLVTFPGYAHAPYREKDHSVNQNYTIIRDSVLEFLSSLTDNPVNSF